MGPPPILLVDDNQGLLTLLVQLFEEAGYQVLSAVKGKQALELAQTTPPKLAVLDMLLPDMMGLKLADALQKDNPNLPVIFMTGVFKGGKHGAEAKQKHNAAGYFEKPFDGQRLVEAVQKLVPAGKRPPAESISAAFEEELELEVEEDQPAEAMELTGRIKVTETGQLTAELRGANLTAQAVQKPQRKPGGPAASIQLPPPAPAAQGRSRKGELTDNLPSLINAFYLSKETGELLLQRDKVKKVIYFERGQPVFALSNLAADRFGQFLVRVGKITPSAQQVAVTQATTRKVRTGDVLIELGLIKETERLYYVAQQVKAIIYSVFAWEQGSYVMSFKERATAEPIKLDIHPANIVVRGIKKLYKPDRLRRLVSAVDRFSPSPQPTYALTDIELERWEADLLPKMDGNRSVSELVALAGRPELVVYGFLAAMLATDIIERQL